MLSSISVHRSGMLLVKVCLAHHITSQYLVASKTRDATCDEFLGNDDMLIDYMCGHAVLQMPFFHLN